ncbi:hypothetical protein ACMFMG_000422 [Clarireedia jacksonii]
MFIDRNESPSWLSVGILVDIGCGHPVHTACNAHRHLRPCDEGHIERVVLCLSCLLSSDGGCILRKLQEVVDYLLLILIPEKKKQKINSHRHRVMTICFVIEIDDEAFSKSPPRNLLLIQLL